MTTPVPLTSVIMVSFHTGPVLDKAIAAVLAQTAPVEIILVNNGNPPEVEAALASRAVTEPRLSLITGQGNIGFGAACNRGAKQAKGEYLLFLNPDSLMPPDAVAKLHARAEKLEGPYMLGARLVGEDGKDQRGCRRALLTPMKAVIEGLRLEEVFPPLRFNFHTDPLPDDMVTMPAISGAFMFIPMAVFRYIGGFDERYFLHVEDLDLCYRLREAEGEIYFVPDIAVVHLGGTSKAPSIFVEKHKARGLVRYFHEHFSHTHPQPVLWLLDAAIFSRIGLKVAVKYIKDAVTIKRPPPAMKTK